MCKDAGLAPSSDPAYNQTPLCGPQIGGILKVGYATTVISLYRCGAAQRQTVGRSDVVQENKIC